MNRKKYVRFLNPVPCSPWKSEAPKLYLSTENFVYTENFAKTSTNSAIANREKDISKQTGKGMAQKRRIVNIIGSTSINPLYKSTILQDAPIQWMNTQDQYACQSGNFEIQNVTHCENMNLSKSGMPANSVVYYEGNTATSCEAKDTQLIELYTTENTNYQYSLVPSPHMKSSAENAPNANNSIGNFGNYIQSNMLISSSVDHHNFPETSAIIPIISPERDLSYVNQDWKFYDTITIDPNDTSTFSSNPNIIIKVPATFQPKVSGKENEQIASSINIPAPQPFTCYTETRNAVVLLGQDDTGYVSMPSTSTDERFGHIYREQPNNELEEHPVSAANEKIPDVQAKKTCATSAKNTTLCKTPNRNQIIVIPLSKQKKLLSKYYQANKTTLIEPQCSMQEEQLNSPTALEKQHDVQQVLGTEHDSVKQLENTKQKFLDENITAPLNYDSKDFQELSNTTDKIETATNLKFTGTIPLVNENQPNNEFINWISGDFDINDKGDIEFPSFIAKTDIVQNVLDSSDTSQNFHESQVKRKRNAKNNKVGVVLKKKKSGYQSALL